MLLVGLSVPEVVFVNLVVGLVTRCAVTVQLRTHVVWSRVGLFALGSIPGAWVGAVVLDVLPLHILKVAAGVLAVLCGISMIIPSRGEPNTPRRPLRPRRGLSVAFSAPPPH